MNSMLSRMMTEVGVATSPPSSVNTHQLSEPPTPKLLSSLNPAAEEFVPASASKTYGMQKSSAQHYFPPPQLESLYIDTTDIFNVESMDLQTTPETYEFSHLDLELFFQDMWDESSEDFSKFLFSRAEYILKYATMSIERALVVAEKILEGVQLSLEHNLEGRKRHRQHFRPVEVKRLLHLASAMFAMDAGFREVFLFRLGAYVDRFTVTQFDRMEVFEVFGLALSELHIGTCISLPLELIAIFNEYFMTSVIQLPTRHILKVLKMCAIQARTILSPENLKILCAQLRTAARPDPGQNAALRDLAELLSSSSLSQNCNQRHEVPVALLTDEESNDLDEFLTTTK